MCSSPTPLSPLPSCSSFLLFFLLVSFIFDYKLYEKILIEILRLYRFHEFAAQLLNEINLVKIQGWVLLSLRKKQCCVTGWSIVYISQSHFYRECVMEKWSPPSSNEVSNAFLLMGNILELKICECTLVYYKGKLLVSNIRIWCFLSLYTQINIYIPSDNWYLVSMAKRKRRL